MNIFRYSKSTFTLPLLSAMLMIALGFNAGCVRAQEATTTTTTATATALTLSRAPYIQSTTTHSVEISWETTLPSNTFVEYKIAGTSTKADFKKVDAVALPSSKLHYLAKLNDLQIDSVYDYRVVADGKVLFSGQFQTDKGATQNYQFDVWGDSGTGKVAQKELAAQIDKSQPDFILHTGDLIYPNGAAGDFDPKFFDVYAKVLSRVPFYGSLGNHDTYTENGQPFLDAFIYPEDGPAGITPERNYYVDYANARIAIIDSNQDEETLRTKITPWLEKIMTESNATWKFAVMHHPTFSSGWHGNTLRIQNALLPIFNKLHLDVVFAGHDHQYERFNPIDGVTYIVTGAGGASLRKSKGILPQSAIFSEKEWSFTKVQVSHQDGKDILRAKQISTTGAVVDQWEISKPEK